MSDWCASAYSSRWIFGRMGRGLIEKLRSEFWFVVLLEFFKEKSSSCRWFHNNLQGIPENFTNANRNRQEFAWKLTGKTAFGPKKSLPYMVKTRFKAASLACVCASVRNQCIGEAYIWEVDMRWNISNRWISNKARIHATPRIHSQIATLYRSHNCVGGRGKETLHSCVYNESFLDLKN